MNTLLLSLRVDMHLPEPLASSRWNAQCPRDLAYLQHYVGPERLPSATLVSKADPAWEDETRGLMDRYSMAILGSETDVWKGRGRDERQPGQQPGVVGGGSPAQHSCG